MKTLLVLFPLVCLAIAAPATTDNGFKITVSDQASQTTEEHTREKKSPQDSPLSLSLSEDNVDVTNIEDEDLNPSARTFKKFKGPIVVRKKTGYHVYRDSDEERAAGDPHENCDKHLRVKLCNEEFTGKSTSKRNIGDENEKADSIKAAHAAIERLQKDVKEFEQGSNGSLQNSPEASKAILQETVEIINNALLQLEKSRSMSIVSHDNSVSSSTKTEAQRHAEWKEMTKNIEHVTDVAKNVEDSFKSADHHFVPLTLHTSTGMSDHHLHQNHHVHKSSDVKHHSTHHELLEHHTSGHHTSGHHAHQFRTHEEGMSSAASEQLNRKMISHENSDHSIVAKASKSADDLSMHIHGKSIESTNAVNLDTQKTLEHISQTKSSEKNWQHSALSGDSAMTGMSTAQRSNIDSSHSMGVSATHKETSNTEQTAKESNTRTAFTEDLKTNIHLNPLVHSEALIAATDSSVSVQGKTVEHQNENHETKTHSEQHKFNHQQSHDGDNEAEIMKQLKGEHTGMAHTSGHDSHMAKHNHNQHGSHGKSAVDFDAMMQPSNQMMMRGWNAKSAMGNMMGMNWKHHPSMARSYGQAYGGYGSSAVGLFPNAKVGGCGVPILLSCSPSVVHGNLVKSHYSAPAYRAAEDHELAHMHEMKLADSILMEDIEKHNTTK